MCSGWYEKDVSESGWRGRLYGLQGKLNALDALLVEGLLSINICDKVRRIDFHSCERGI